LSNIESRDSNFTHNTNAIYTRNGPQRNFAVSSDPPAHHSGAGIVDESIWLYLRNALDPDSHFGHPWTALCHSSQRYCIRVSVPVLNRVSSCTDNLDGHNLELDKHSDLTTGKGKAQATSSIFTAYTGFGTPTATSSSGETPILTMDRVPLGCAITCPEAIESGECDHTVACIHALNARALRPTPVIDSGSMPLRGRLRWTWWAGWGISSMSTCMLAMR
jgi:hypothetical protein